MESPSFSDLNYLLLLKRDHDRSRSIICLCDNCITELLMLWTNSSSKVNKWQLLAEDLEGWIAFEFVVGEELLERIERRKGSRQGTVKSLMSN